MTEQERQAEPTPQSGEPKYEPPRAEEISSDGRVATAAWIKTK